MNKKIKTLFSIGALTMVLLNLSSMNASAAPKVYSKVYATGGSSTTISSSTGNNLYTACEFRYMKLGTADVVSVRRSAGMQGPTYLNVGASTSVRCVPVATVGTHRISGKEFYERTSIAYYR